jgi:lipopolysaccharide export system protein LptA
MDEVRGQFISYDGMTENYLVTSGPNGTSAAAAGKPDRVRAIIQPKKDGKPVNPAAPGVQLKAAPDIAKPREE